MEPLFWIILLVLGVSLVYDVRYHRIPNWLTLPAIMAGVVYHAYAGGIGGLTGSLLGMFLGFAVFVGFYLAGGMGAGDVKLMAAVGAFLGPQKVLFAALYTVIAGGIYAIFLFTTHKGARAMAVRYARMIKGVVSTGHFVFIPKGKTEEGARLYYAIAIAAGTLAVLVERLI